MNLTALPIPELKRRIEDASEMLGARSKKLRAMARADLDALRAELSSRPLSRVVSDPDLR